MAVAKRKVAKKGQAKADGTIRGSNKVKSKAVQEYRAFIKAKGCLKGKGMKKAERIKKLKDCTAEWRKTHPKK